MTPQLKVADKKRAYLEQRLQQKPQNRGGGPGAIPKRVSTGPCELSFAQQRLWFLDQLEPGKSTYNMGAAFRLTGPLNRPALQQSLAALVQRHETLRTTFALRNDQPVQVIAPAQPVPLPRHNLHTLPPNRHEPEAHRQVNRHLQRPFDLAAGPLFRATLLRLADQDHILILSMHHIVSDGWSMGILYRELSALYAAFAANQPNPLPDLPLQYADFALWQRAWLQGDTLDRQLAYWKNQLAGVPPVLDLPTDRPRPPVQTFRGATQTLVLPPPLAEALRRLSRQAGATLFMTLLAAFKVLLQRYTGQDDIVVGSPIANRNRAQIEGLIGFFVNTLVLRTDLSGDPTFLELLKRVRQTALGAYEHQDLPVEQIIEALPPNRDLSHNSLFQVLFAFQNMPAAPLQLPGISVKRLDPDNQTAKLDLSLYTVDTPNEAITITAEYNTDLFNPDTIKRMLDHYETLLAGITNQPSGRLSNLPLLSDAERHKLLIEWNDTGVDYPASNSLTELFEAQVEQTPTATAFIFNDQHLSFEELNRQANRLAHHLQTLGVGPGVRVGLYLERSLEAVVALLAVFKAGGVYVPLDPAYPSERLAYVINDAQVAVLLTHSKFKKVLPSGRATVVYLDTERATIAQLNPQNSVCRLSPNDLAYIIYTSGSTGKPKGVAVPHKQILNRLAWMWQKHPFEPDDVSCQKTALNFVDSIWEIFGPLLQCSPTVIISDEILRDPTALVGALKRHNVTRLWLVPTLLRVLLDTTPNLQHQLPRLKFWVTSGEAITTELWQRFQTEMPHSTLFNLYGTSEVWDATWYVPEPGRELFRVPIGRPLNNVQVYILDRYLKPAPIGVPGELYIGGEGLALGYLNQPWLTAEKFIPHPFGHGADTRLYATGDLARYLPEGQIEFVGRVDHQVKIRGFRIELGEIEAILNQHPAVKNCAVIVREDIANDRRLVAYFVRHQGSSATTGPLRQFLREKLPEYMIPSALILLDALPLTPSGKLNRLALPAPSQTRLQLDTVFTPPRSGAEKKLAGIWSDVLGLKQIGIHDDFFELGGHSLLLTQVVSRIRDAFQAEIPLRLLFEIPTIAGLAEHLESTRQAEHGSQQTLVKPATRDESLPLSFAQQRLWFLDQLEPGKSTYNMGAAFRLTGPLNHPALQQSLAALVQRHETLRTTFTLSNGQPVQVIALAQPVPLPLHNLQTLPPHQREPEAHRQVNRQLQRPFDLAAGPLFRATLLRLTDQDHILILSMHHIVSDGWSMGILYRELSALYAAFAANQPNPLPDLPLQCADFALWQRAWLQGDTLDRQLAYWKNQLAGVPPVLDLPTDRPRPPVQTFRGATQTLVLSAPLAQALRRLSRQAGTTLFMTLLAAFKVLLQRYTGQDDIVVGSPIANRNRAQIEGLIGFFVNTLVLRTDLSGNPTFLELLKRVRQTALGAYEHQDLPFEKLVEELQPERHLSHNPLFQVMFALQNAPDHQLQLRDLSTAFIQAEVQATKFDLSWMITDADETLAVTLTYSSDLFDAATINRMLGHFQVLLQAIVIDPNQSIATLPLLTEAERQQILVEWNDTATAYPRDRCIHHLFEAQVERTPNATAVIFGEQHLTYRQLNNRANQLAHYLQQQGVGPDDRVALCVERSLEMVIGILGILKAGGAYVPLDPAYPAERLAYMLRDSRASLLLTQAHLQAALPPPNVAVLCLDSGWGQVAAAPMNNPVAPVSPERLAYVIYTSGSTGNPKGVMVEHCGMVNYLTWALDFYQVPAGHGAPVNTSLSFDATVTSLFLPLLCGQPVLLLPETNELEALTALLTTQSHFSLVKLTPAHLEALGQLVPPAKAAGGTRTFVIGGEALLSRTLAFWQTHAPQTRLINEYGPTETVVGCCVFDVPRGDLPGEQVPIGRPIANTRLYILDSRQQPLPVGVTGELYIGGAGVARGYLNRPNLTAEKFVADPFSQEPGARLYKTGDMARYRPDGRIEFLGRTDHQIKIRGFRIELGEIESVLSRHPAVKQSAVVVHEEKPGDRRLVAYVVTQTHPHPSARDLRTFLKQTLPEYMIPAAFVWLDELPLTANGKADHQALPRPDYTPAVSKNKVDAARDSVEQSLVDIWQNVLGVDNVGVHDNFFEMGGHSLLAINLFVQIEKTFDRKLPLATIFQAPTVAQLADAIRQKTGAAEWSPLVTIQPGGSRPPFFCVHGWGGGVVGYAELARLLGPDQPFYGLQARGTTGQEAPHTQITEMATAYLKAVQTVQPVGPYYLGGYCQGGIIAFEMAQQLKKQGEEVALVAVFDSYAPIRESLRQKLQGPNAITNFAKNLYHWLGDFWQLGPAGMIVHLRRKIKIFWKRRFGMAGKTFSPVSLGDLLDDTSHIPEYLRNLMEIHYQATVHYTPQIFPGKVTLFRVRGLSPWRSFDPQLGWGKLARRGVETKMIGGAHRNILEPPQVQTLAKQLTASLTHAQGKAPDSAGGR